MRNGVLRQLRRLRSPRYAIAGLFGLLYFYLIFGGWMSGEEAGTHIGEQWLVAGRGIGPLMLGLLASWWWLWGGYRHGLMLTPAETNLLLPAPITRRQVIRYRILAAQPAILFSAVLGSLITRGTDLPPLLRLLAIWVLIATLHQHQIAASLVHAAAGQQGRSGLRRQVVPIALFAAAFLVLAWSLFHAIGDMRAEGTLAFVLQRIGALLQETGPRIVLTPFRLLLAPTLATTAAEWLPAFGIALAVLALHFLWVLRTDTAFEEAAAEAGARRAEQIAAVRSGGLSRLRFTSGDRPKRLSRPLLPLAPTGRAAWAIFWKNVLYVQRLLRPTTFAIIAGGIVATVLVSGGGGPNAFRAVATLLAMFGGLVTILGPLAVRNDLRMDLRFVDQLRTYPIRGRDLVAAEIAAATVCITLPQFVLVLTGIALFVLAGLLAASHAAMITAAAILALPVLNALAVTIQNALALLYPSWSRIGDTHGGGMESVGQNMITLIGTIILLVIFAIVPAIVAALVGGPLLMVAGPAAVPAAALAFIAAVAGELVLIVWWLGGLYDRTDPSLAS